MHTLPVVPINQGFGITLSLTPVCHWRPIFTYISVVVAEGDAQHIARVCLKISHKIAQDSFDLKVNPFPE